jgi:hypothetical protein
LKKWIHGKKLVSEKVDYDFKRGFLEKSGFWIINVPLHPPVVSSARMRKKWILQ